MANPVSKAFAKLAQAVTVATGSSWAFIIALSTIVIWGVLGPTFHYSDTWQLVINTSTTIITFLMVFVIQHSANKDMRAVQIKLDELISSIEGASNKLIDVEDLSDEEVEKMYKDYQKLAAEAAKHPPGAAISVEAADQMLGRAREAAGVAEQIAEHARHRAGKHAGHRDAKRKGSKRS